MKIDLNKLTIRSAHESLKNGDFTSVELTRAYLDQIKVKNKDVHAYLEVFGDALEQAKAADARIGAAKKSSSTSSSTSSSKTPSKGSPDFPLLCGIPCAIKDNILIKGRVAGAASKMLEKYRAPYDATVIGRLKNEGAVFLGRTNMDEFAMGGSTENSAYGPTKNPLDLSRVAGGSSGGSAAAVAMDGALFALGSDTGGSIRQPASFCGVIGLKPTYGAVSRYGVMAMGSSLDQIGPIAKTVADCEAVFNVIRGKDVRDGTTIWDESRNSDIEIRSKSEIRNTKGRSKPAKPIIGVPRHFLGGDGIDPAVLKAFNAAIDSFKSKGYEIRDIQLPNISYSLPVYYIVMPAEVSSNMARFDGMRYGLHVSGKDGIGDYFETRRAGLGREVIRRILLGTYVLSSGYYDAYYNHANAVRSMITDDFLKAFDPKGGGVDVIATPTAPSPAFKIGEKTADPVAMYLEDIFTVTANLTGLPAMSIPCGVAPKDSNGREHDLPVGLQLTARHGDETTLCATGKDFLGELKSED